MAMDRMRRAAGLKDTAELYKALDAGQLKMPTIMKFLELMKEDSNKGGALEASKTSTQAGMNRFGNSWSDFVDRLWKGGMDKSLGGFFESMAKNLDKSSGLIKVLNAGFKLASTIVTSIADSVSVIIKALTGGEEAISSESGIFKFIGLLAATTPIGRTAIAIATIAGAIQDLSRFNNGESSWIADMMKAHPEDAKSIEGIAKGLIELFSNLKSLVEDTTKALGKFLTGDEKDLGFLKFLSETLKAINDDLRVLHAILFKDNTSISKVNGSGFLGHAYNALSAGATSDSQRIAGMQMRVDPNSWGRKMIPVSVNAPITINVQTDKPAVFEEYVNNGLQDFISKAMPNYVTPGS